MSINSDHPLASYYIDLHIFEISLIRAPDKFISIYRITNTTSNERPNTSTDENFPRAQV
jgi:hypothetical protein